MIHSKLGSRALTLALVTGLLPMGFSTKLWAGQEVGVAGGGTNLAELSLEELTSIKVETVYGASKREQKTTEAPSSVSIVTQDDIKQYGHRTLAEILNSVRGFYVTSDRGYSQIGVRGVNRPGDFGGRLGLKHRATRSTGPGEVCGSGTARDSIAKIFRT